VSVIEFGHFVLTIAILLVSVHGLGYIAERLKQPRIVGEILAGILLGPFVLKAVAATAYASSNPTPNPNSRPSGNEFTFFAK